MRDAHGRPQTVALIGSTSDICLAAVDSVISPHTTEIIAAGRRPPEKEWTTPTRFIEYDALDLGLIESVVDQLFAGADLDAVIIGIGRLSGEGDSLDEVADMLTVNGVASLLLAERVFERLAVQGHGSLVMLSSIARSRPRPSNWLYGASKEMLDFGGRALVDRGRSTGVDVVICRLGFVRTSMTEGMSEAPFAIDAPTAGKAIASAIIDHQRGVVWVPGVGRVLSSVLQVLPFQLLARIDR